MGSGSFFSLKSLQKLSTTREHCYRSWFPVWLESRDKCSNPAAQVRIHGEADLGDEFSQHADKQGGVNVEASGMWEVSLFQILFFLSVSIYFLFIVNAIESTEEKKRTIIEIKKKLKLTKIQLQWIRAHNGTVRNERADALAKLATSKEQIDTEFGPSKAKVRYRGKALLATKWQERWNNSAKGSWTKKFFKEVKFNMLYGDFYYNQVLTGHGVFGAHQERLFGKEGGCSCGEQRETIEHILLKCKIWGEERDDWPKGWLQKDISDLVIYSPFKKGAIVILKKLMPSRLTS
ncbi:hypothetical protein AVEN_98178-1 [Araneus ventricosus]|uniref:RNase H type-1 domain-containing protein n=1 Tax=Araneus ventricosus TaxID=182803 RepID=A0A4Y2GVY7_ARAVE|nr:hypothetical protein AVEN_98178-1 [Araneus ventricosus]